MEVERTSVVEDRGWELAEASVSPRGGGVVVTATATTGQPGVRVFVVDLDTFFVSEWATTPRFARRTSTVGIWICEGLKGPAKTTPVRPTRSLLFAVVD